MKIILLKDVKGVGKKYEEKEVSNGYGANFLIPRKLAVPLSGSSAAAIKALKEQDERKKVGEHEELLKTIAKISGTSISVKMKTNDKGHLYSSISKEKISELLKEKGLDINEEYIEITEPIKETGTFEVPVSLGDGKKKGEFTLEVVPE